MVEPQYDVRPALREDVAYRAASLAMRAEVLLRQAELSDDAGAVYTVRLMTAEFKALFAAAKDLAEIAAQARHARLQRDGFANPESPEYHRG